MFTQKQRRTNRRVRTGFLIPCILFLAVSVSILTGCEDPYDGPTEACDISLSGLSTGTTSPGDTFSLYGRWGAEQGTKYVRIFFTGGNANLKPDVVSWSNYNITVQVPDVDHFNAYNYGIARVNVFCHDNEDGLVSSDEAFINIVPPDVASCGIRLSYLNKTEAYPGDTIRLYGSFGSTRGTKTVYAYLGPAHGVVLPVVSWSRSRLVVQIPEDIPTNYPRDYVYNIAVHCDHPDQTSSYCTEFEKLTILYVK